MDYRARGSWIGNARRAIPNVWRVGVPLPMPRKKCFKHWKQETRMKWLQQKQKESEDQVRIKIVWSVCSSVNITYFRSSGRLHVTWNCSRRLFTCQGWYQGSWWYCSRSLLTCRAWDCSGPLLTKWMWRAPHIKSDTRGKCTCILYTHWLLFSGFFYLLLVEWRYGNHYSWCYNSML